MKIIFTLQLMLVSLSFLLSPFTLYAKNIEYTSLAPITTSEGTYVKTKETIDNNSFNTYLDNMFKLGIALCTGLAVLMLIIGGIQYVSSDAWSKKTDGRDRMFAALFGLLIALGSYALLRTINPSLLNTDLKLATLNIESIKERQVPTTIYSEPSNGTNAYPAPNSSGVTYADAPGQTFAQGEVGIDFDGSPGAYQIKEVPDGTPGAVVINGKSYQSVGYENLGNAGGPGNWYGVQTDTGTSKGNPIINADGSLNGITSLGNVNGDTTAFAVLTSQQLSTIRQSNPNFKLGDTVLVTNTSNNKTIQAVYADYGGTMGANHTEISPAAANALGIDYGKNNGKSYANGTVVYSLPPTK